MYQAGPAHRAGTVRHAAAGTLEYYDGAQKKGELELIAGDHSARPCSGDACDGRPAATRSLLR